jgi:glycerol-3-phosphate dehydrogenase
MTDVTVAVVGSGSWGTAVAALAAGHTDTVLWARRDGLADDIERRRENPEYLPGVRLPDRLRATGSLSEAVAAADVLVMGVPSHGFRSVLMSAAGSLRADGALGPPPIVSLAKGIEQETLLRMTEVVAEVLPGHPRERVGVLTGPNLSLEVALGQPAAAVIGMPDEDVAAVLQQLFMAPTFRVYTNHDVVGCEIAGALKNVMALAAGMAHGLGYGDNAKAALITRGLAELTRLGVVLGGPAVAIDRGGGLRLAGGGRFEWWIGADDRWRFPSREVASRQRLVDGLPVAETAVRVPGGDAVQRVWVVAGPSPVAVVEIENASPVPFAVALVTLGDVALGLARPVGAHARGDSLDDVRRTVTSGGAVLTGAAATDTVATDPAATGVPAAGNGQANVAGGATARLVPVAHRTRVRAAVPLTATSAGTSGAPDPDQLPGADVVLRGWRAVLDRTARVLVPDEAIQEAITTARARLLLPLDEAERRAPARLAALTAWGFPQEVVALGAEPVLGPFPDPASDGWDGLGPPDDPASLLRLRSLLVDDADGALALLPGFPPAWAGQPIEVHDLPTRGGRLSFAVRWHGARPALLWDTGPPPEVPPDMVVRAPALDPSWTGHGAAGEALLGPVPRPAASDGP